MHVVGLVFVQWYSEKAIHISKSFLHGLPPLFGQKNKKNRRQTLNQETKQNVENEKRLCVAFLFQEKKTAAKQVYLSVWGQQQLHT